MPRAQHTLTDTWNLYEFLMTKTHIDSSRGCWVWTGTHERQGYGVITITGKLSKVHRVAWQLYYGPIPVGKHVCHRCDNPPCWNPSHLWLGTNLENHRDSALKKRRVNNLARFTPEIEARRIAKLRRGEGVWHLAVLTEPEVVEMRALYDNGTKIADLARRYGRNSSTIEHVVHRRSWKHLA